MKAKSLIGIAVASTFGWSAATFAGTGHEVATPFSPNESGENIVLLKDHQALGSGFSQQMVSVGSTSVDAGGSIGGSVDSSDHYSSFDHSAPLGMDDSLAMSDSWSGMDELALGDEGIYSEYYIVSWTPMTVETWDVYLIDDGSSSGDELALSSDQDFMSFSSYDTASSSFDSSGFSSELDSEGLGE